MADISQVKLPNGDTYNLVDETSGYITLPDLPVYDGTVVEDGDGYVATPFFITETEDTSNNRYVLNKTAGEITVAWEAGRQIWIKEGTYSYLVDEIYVDNSDGYLFSCATAHLRTTAGHSPSYSAVSASEYPHSDPIFD